jgi:hypothetical protein
MRTINVLGGFHAELTDVERVVPHQGNALVVPLDPSDVLELPRLAVKRDFSQIATM